MPNPCPSRYAPHLPLPPYAYVPGHGLPHPVNDPAGHSRAAPAIDDRQRWLHAIDLFNGGFAWEAHEAWEGVWNALGRTTPAARFVQGLIHLAAAAVKIREGRPEGVRRHGRRARELLAAAAVEPAATRRQFDSLGIPPLSPESLAALLTELAAYQPACWHTSRAPVVRVLAANLLLASDG